MSDTTADFGIGNQNPNTSSSDYNVTEFIINQILGRVRTVALVQVVSCTNSGGVSPVGMVSARPLVNMLDGAGNPTPHGIIYNLPYIRVQGGVTGAVICDPKPLDIGLALICDRDISSAKANAAAIMAGTQQSVNPGSWRRFNLADGIFWGLPSGGTPTTYVRFDGEGNFEIVAPSSNTGTISAGTLILHGVNEFTFDAGGTGAVYKPGSIETYTDGVPSTHTTPDPPGPLV